MWSLNVVHLIISVLETKGKNYRAYTIVLVTASVAFTLQGETTHSLDRNSAINL